MTLFLEEKQGCEVRALKRELTRLKNKRLRMMERGEVIGLKKIENGIKSIRWRLGRTNERKAIHETDLTDIEHLRVNHTYDEYLRMRASGAKRIHVLWGVSCSELTRWIKEEEKRMEQTQATAIEVVTQEQLQQQVEDLQNMLHGYENELNAASEAHNGTINELAKVRAELEGVRSNFQRVQKDLQHTQDMLQREKVRSASYQSTIRELEHEVDEYATLLGDAEQQHNVLKQVAKPLLQQVLDTL